MPLVPWILLVALGLFGCGMTRLGVADAGSSEDAGSRSPGAGSGGVCSACDASLPPEPSASGGPGGISATGGATASGGASGARDATAADAEAPADARPAPADGGVDDGTPPVFGGLVSVEIGPRPLITSGSITRRSDVTAARLSWQPATDARTPRADIRYRVYAAKAPGAQDFGAPLVESSATTTVVASLDSNTTYYFVVRAVDGNGNVDGNTVERSLRTLVSFENDVQPMFTRTCAFLFCHTKGLDGTNSPIQGMDLDPGASLTNIVNVVAREGALAGRPRARRIDTRTGDPMDSYLWLTMIDDPSIFGYVMPPPVVTQSGVNVTAEEMDAFRQWIIESKDAFPLQGCEAAPADRPPGLECPSATETILNGDFESGADHWNDFNGGIVEVVEDRPGNHALRLSNETYERSSALACTDVFVPATGMAIRATLHGDPNAGVMAADSFQTVTAPADGSTADLRFCLNDVPGFTTPYCFRLAGSDWYPGIPTESVFVDDIRLEPDPACQ
jgi:hypothetical protein